MEPKNIEGKTDEARSCAAAGSAQFSKWSEARGVWPRLTHEEIWNTAWNAALETAIMRTPGGYSCDPQYIADLIRELLLPNHKDISTSVGYQSPAHENRHP